MNMIWRRSLMHDVAFRKSYIIDIPTSENNFRSPFGTVLSISSFDLHGRERVACVQSTA